MAASSVSTPMGRPSPESTPGCGRGSATGWSCARRTSASCGTSRPDAGFGAVDGLLFDLGLSSFQLADTRPRLRLPGRRTARHALRHEPRRPGGGAARDARRRRADRALPALRRGAERPPDRPRDRRRTRARRPSRPPRSWPRSSSASSPRQPRVRRRIHPATRVFQALRIAVNEELDALQDGLAAAVDLLRPGGRLVVLSLPLARGPDRQAVPRRRAEGLHLPAGAAGLRLRPDRRGFAS